MTKFLCLVFCLSSIASQAQSVKGLVKDSDQKALANATITLHRAKDSGVAKLAVSDQEGKFSMTGIREGQYLVSASYVGHRQAYSSVFSVSSGSEVNLPAILLSKVNTGTNEVTVTARRQLVEVKADKTVFNVEGTINAAGQDVLELLRKAPGVQIDKDDNISVSGKNGVQVFVDGKPSPLAGKDLSEYLKTVQSAQVEAIEIITNPSAKYEAAGNAGIINIRLKRNKSLGTNGSVNLGYGIGIYPKYNGGFALNHRSKTINLFGNYTYTRTRSENPFNLYREVADSIFDQHAVNHNRNNSHNFKFGVDFLLNRFNTVGFMVNGVRADPRNLGVNHTMIRYQPTKAAVKQIRSTNENINQRDNTNYNVNFKHTDTLGRDFNFDADYAEYDIFSDQMLTNIRLDASGNTETSREVNNMLSPTDIKIYSAKADYEQHFKKGRLGIGGKVSFIKTDNDFQRYNINGTVKDLDKDKSNRFRYNEQINAGYINYNRQLKGWMYQVGVRVESTVTEGRSTGLKSNNGTYVSYDTSFERSYTDFFPSAAITFNKNPRNQWSLSYSRRIDRPAYQDLNPFEFKLDEYTYMKGNTELRPQYTHSFSLTNIYGFKLTTSLTYSHTDDVFAQLTDTTEKSKSYLTRKNLATQDNIGLNISFPFQYKGYSLFTNLNAYYSHYVADFGPGSRKIDQSVFSYRFFAQNSLKLSKTITAELSGWINGPGLWGGTFKTKLMGQMDIGLQKTMLKGKGNIRLSYNDLLNTFKFDSQTFFAGQHLRAYGSSESQVFRVNFSYRFGNTQVKAARNRKTAAEEENSRTSGGGGLGGN
ncbi:MAG TPA: TonB dependent receptor [Chitinophagaceae bacterium]